MAPHPPPSPLPSLKILMLHGLPLSPSTPPGASAHIPTGYTQSGPLFDIKSRALQKSLVRALPAYSLSFSHPTGPHRVQAPDVGGDVDAAAEAETYGWWRRVSDDPILYDGMPAGFATIAETISARGPFDGVIGFSQGAALAAVVASALEADTARRLPPQFPRLDVPGAPAGNGAVQGPLKFAIIYSGFRVADQRCAPFFEPPISTPTLHVLGQLDSVVEEARAKQLLEVCRDGAVVVHPGGHFLPSQRAWLDAAVGFIKKSVEDKGKGGRALGEGEEVDVRDMEVPF